VPHTILVGKQGNSVTYNIAAVESFAIESLSAEIDTTAVTPGVESYCDVIFEDNAGLLIARSRSSKTLPDGGTVTITFAPWLPDTLELGLEGDGYVNTTGLCATTLPAGGSVTVAVSDPAAVVKGFRMWVEDSLDEGAGAAQFGPWALVPGAGA
jgi:hypothetical protein